MGASSSEYQAELQWAETLSLLQLQSESQNQNGVREDFIEKALEMGTINLDWLREINSKRKVPIQLTTPGEVRSYPIDKPIRYSPKITQETYNEYIEEMPKAMSEVFLGKKPTSTQLPAEESVYRDWARKVDRLYQMAARWKGVSRFKDWYRRARERDVRGYYYLSQREDVEQELTHFSQLPEELQNNYLKWLENICVNQHGVGGFCITEVSQKKSKGQLWSLYQKYIEEAKAVYNDFFTLVNARKDIVWEDPKETLMPFKTPDTEEVRSFVKDNIEEEWKFELWNLKIDFSNKAQARIRFVPGVTPNVNGLGGNVITMDANQSIEEWEVKWTIRHEFGHVLGFPDCYVEFYDEQAEEMVNYQIDVDNLMCSRAGKIQKTHFDEMKGNYFRP